jgi:hypothetical protein
MQNNTNDNAFNYNKLPNQGYSNTLHDVAAVDPYQIAAQQRLMPRELKSGSQRGEMTIQGKLTVRNPDTDERVVIGSVDGEFGIFGAEATAGDDSSLNIAWKAVGQTFYYYDLDDGRNIMQVGKLPDGTYNFASAKATYEVEDAF